jgi:hypothetical protein
VSIQELEAEALKLSPTEREELVRRLLSHLNDGDALDPLLGLGANPVECGVADASVNHDGYLYGTAE